MNAHPAFFFDEDLRIPAEVINFTRFRRWCQSGDSPERGRIDFLAGEVYVDRSPENLYFHGRVKTAIAVGLHAARSPTSARSTSIARES